MEIYVDNMLVKSLKADKYIDNLRESFEVLREYKMKLNQKNAPLELPQENF